MKKLMILALILAVLLFGCVMPYDIKHPNGSGNTSASNITSNSTVAGDDLPPLPPDDGLATSRGSAGPTAGNKDLPPAPPSD